MKLKKTFSSLITFPKIINGQNYYNKNKNILQKDLFLTLNTSDDENFARGIHDKLEKKLIMNKKNHLKLWEKGKNNDIYNSNWKSNKNILRNKGGKLNLNENNLLLSTFDKNNHKEVFKTQSKNIFNIYLTTHNYKYMNKLKSKYPKLSINTEKMSVNSKELGFHNYISNLLQHERNKIIKDEKEYNESLIKENLLLNKDIRKFEVFQVNQNVKFQNSDKEVQKFRRANALIYEAVKMTIHEYHTTLNKIQQIIKEIIKLEEYVLFIYKVLGYEEDIANLDELNNYKISLNASNLLEIEKNINNIYMQSNILINNIFEHVVEELTFDDEKIYYVINNVENMILKKLSENEDIKADRFKLENEFRKDMKNYQKKYNNYMLEYISILKFYQEEIEKFNIEEKNVQFSSEFQVCINYISEIKDILRNNNDNKYFNKPVSLVYGNTIIPCLEEVKKKEFFIDDILKRMEVYEKEDIILFNKCLYNCRLNNRKKKLKREKEMVEDKELQEKIRLLEKHKKIFIKNKFRYNLPHKQIKESLSDISLKRK